jgi:hypothetical protein
MDIGLLAFNTQYHINKENKIKEEKRRKVRI